MTPATDGPAISGPPYTVIEIDGRPPTGLNGCLGDRTLTLVRNGLSHRIHGTGIDHPAGIRFHQKDLGPDGQDVRVWTITHPGNDVLLARHRPSSEPPAARQNPRDPQDPRDPQEPQEPREPQGEPGHERHRDDHRPPAGPRSQSGPPA